MENEDILNKIGPFLTDKELIDWIINDGNLNSPFLAEYKKKYVGHEKYIDQLITLLLSLRKDQEEYSPQIIVKSLVAMQKKIKQEKRQLMKRRIYTAVASSAAILLVGFLLYYTIAARNNTDSLYADFFTNDKEIVEDISIVVDRNKPIEVKEDNAQIEMKEGGGIWIEGKQIKEESVPDRIIENEIMVPRGKRTNVVLPDGSKVWINSGSRILYRSDFSENRRLYVDGEVYLEVKKNKKKPFILKSSHLEVEVLGTIFNLNDYNNGLLSSVVLVEGKVEVTAKNGKTVQLKPNEKFDYLGTNSQIKNVDVFEYICWKDDIANFKGRDLSHILTTLAEYYNVQIDGVEDVKGIRCGGNLDLNQSFEEVLKCISFVSPITYTMEGEKAVVKIKK